MRVDRPWGYYTVLEETPGYKLKEIVVSPNSCLSYQRHERRSEIWFVTEGKGTMIRNAGALALEPHDYVIIRAGEWHQLINGSNERLRIIEIQHGEECSEEDIERQ